MLEGPRVLTEAAGPVAGQTTPPANSIAVLQPRPRPRRWGAPTATAPCREFDAQNPRRPVTR